MIIARKNNLGIISTTVSSLLTDPTPVIDAVGEDGKKHSITKDSKSQRDIVEMLSKNPAVIVDNINIEVVELNYQMNNQKFQSILKLSDEGYVPEALYKVDNDGYLEEEPVKEFVNGNKKVGYIDPSHVSNFILALIKDPVEEKGEKPMKALSLTNELRAAITKAYYQSEYTDDAGNSYNRYALKVSVDTINNITSEIQANFVFSDKEAFEKEMRVRFDNMKETSYMSDDEKNQIIKKFSGLLFSHTFYEIDADAISKVELSDFIALHNIKKGITEIPKNLMSNKDVKRKMLQNFAEKNNIEITATALNYSIAGRTKEAIPVFYESAALKTSDESSPVNFQKAVKNATADLNNKNFDKEHVVKKAKRQPEYLYAYIKKILAQGKELAYSNKISKEEKIEKMKTIDALTSDTVKTFFPDNRKLKSLLENEKIYSINVLETAMAHLKGKTTNKLDVKLTANGDRIRKQKGASPVRLEQLYQEGSKVLTLSSTMDIQKANFGSEDNEVRKVTGYVPQNITSFSYDPETKSYTPTMITNLPVRQNKVEVLGSVISNLAKLNENGKITYINADKEEVEYAINVSNSVEYFKKGISGLLYNSEGAEIKGKAGVAFAFNKAKNEIDAAFSSSNDPVKQIEALKQAIENSKELQVFKDIGDSPRVDNRTYQKYFFSYLNNDAINNHIEKNSKDLLGSYVTDNLKLGRVDTKEKKALAKSMAAKSVLSSLVKIFKNSKIINYYNNKDVNVFAKKTFAFAQSMDQYKDFTPEQQANVQKYMTLKKYVNNMSNIINAKKTGNISGLPLFGVNSFTDKVVKSYMYPMQEKVVSNGNEYTVQTTNTENLKKFVEVVSKQNKDFSEEINQEIESKLEVLSTLDGNKSEVSLSGFLAVEEENNANATKKDEKEVKEIVTASIPEIKQEVNEENNDVNLDELTDLMIQTESETALDLGSDFETTVDLDLSSTFDEISLANNDEEEGITLGS